MTTPTPGLTGLDALEQEVIDHRFKGLPPDALGMTMSALAAEHRPLFDGGFTTPVLTLSADALEHNLALLGEYSRRHGLDFAPHGKTSMAPQLFQRQLAHGAWGITAAVPHQLRVYRAFRTPTVLLANELVDPAALRWLAEELAGDPEFRFLCFVDSVRGVELMDRVLAEATPAPAVEVLIDVGGGPGARTGVRSTEEALTVAEAVAAAPRLRLAGVAGYEGEVPGADPDRVADYLRGLVDLTARLDELGRFPGELTEIVLSAGGSAWFDVVSEVFADTPALSRPLRKVLRSGAYVSHDHGQYQRVTPFNRVPAEGELEPAFLLWAQCLSRPEPGQGFLNAGKRDAAHDLHLPTPLLVRSQEEGTVTPARGMSVTKLSDQHTWLDTNGETPLEVGDWVGLGLSHPCTIFDKWQVIPEVDAEGRVTRLIRTFF
ncbi:amino acid deaminase [Streptomyces sp. NPDC005438]|uniref:amino acid deaminase n=1 Tax=Streptomyces sp. NPDC005438 TaxID=3156880 RepID=UPI0033A4D9D2